MGDRRSLIVVQQDAPYARDDLSRHPRRDDLDQIARLEHGLPRVHEYDAPEAAVYRPAGRPEVVGGRRVVRPVSA